MHGAVVPDSDGVGVVATIDIVFVCVGRCSGLVCDVEVEVRVRVLEYCHLFPCLAIIVRDHIEEVGGESAEQYCYIVTVDCYLVFVGPDVAVLTFRSVVVEAYRLRPCCAAVG